ncbi:cytochrome P450 [Podospora aff. communis PSN243]|uniref:Cytochrome P450 n=1 Tax=Podospora aff. communis PSN243 TaxID=3040156 RepID=A0AAV9GE23_9PEZI|nr:cytochrome P450 [Podospora aff. communis PSN243]
MRESSLATMETYLTAGIALYAVQGLLLWAVSTAVYRHYFHPLAHIPGPPVAGVTRLYIWYWNVIRDGHLYRQLEDLHAQYGPVVRIGPNEVHLSDPDNYDKVYSVGGPFYKDPVFYGALRAPCMFTAISNEEHRQRRAPLNHFFSRRAVLDLEDIAQQKAQKLLHRVRESLNAGTPADLRAGLRAVSIDVLTEYAFADCWDHLGAPDFNQWFSEAVRDTGLMWWIFQQFPFVLTMMQAIPDNYARKMSPAMNGWIDCIVRTRDYISLVQKNFAAGIKPQRRTIFHELLDPTTADEETPIPPTLESLSGEALSFFTAAADTTGNALETAAYHVVSNPSVYRTLVEELRTAFPDPSAQLDFITFEKLPFFTGVIREGQRLSYGVISRLPRVAPEGGATFNGYHVPSGTTVSMSSWMMHRNEEAFPSPDVFDPTRWTNPRTLRAREKCLVGFSRGSRACIGQNLALCELYVTLGTLFRHFDNLEPFEVGTEDMTYVDYFSAFHPKGSRAFRVVAKGET